MTIAIVVVLTDLPRGFDALREEASREGYTHMDRLAADWRAGTNRFDAAGEVLLSAYMADTLAGIGGMNIDPADPTALRLRRFYVRMSSRRHGIARRLAETLMAKARQLTDHVVLNAESELATRFWEAMGFVPDHCDGHSHVRRWSD
jgi:GNAT superfamily N-acetyltransferase